MRDWDAHFARTFEALDARAQSRLGTRRVRRRVDYAKGMFQDERRRSAGDVRVAELVGHLDAFPMVRAPHQRMFHRHMLSATLAHLYRDDPHVDLLKVMATYNLGSCKSHVLFMAPRRFGKTVSVAMFAAALLMSSESSVQAIFSTGKRASGMLLEQIFKFYDAVGPGLGMTLVKKNMETLQVRGPGGGDDVRKIFGYPADAKTLRGVSADMIYLEEAAFIPQSVFFEVIVPLLEVENTGMIAISTPQDSLNLYSELFELKDEKGQPLFDQIKLSLACEKCQREGRAASCTHNRHLIPPWKSNRSNDMVRAIYGARTDLMERESLGVISQDQTSVFPEHMVGRVFHRRVAPPVAPTHVYCAIDPNGGGASRMSIVSGCFDDGAFVVVGLDAHAVKTHAEIEAFTKAHLHGLRERFPHPFIVLFVEANMGNEAAFLEAMVRPMRRIHVVRESARRMGVMTTAEKKRGYVEQLRFFLQGDNLRMAEAPCVGNPFVDPDVAAKAVQRRLMEEMSAYRKVVKTDARGQTKVHYSGKIGGGQDDVVMALQILVYHACKVVARAMPHVDYALIGL